MRKAAMYGFAAMFAVSAGLAMAATAGSPDAAVAAVGAPANAPADAPVLVVETLDHGRFDLAAQRGKWVVLNFWATWCSPCLKEIPDLSRFAGEREDVRVIGLAYEEITAEDMRAFLGKHPAAYPIAIIDVYAPPAGIATPRGLPTTHLVGPDGRLAKSFLGPVTSAELARAIAAAGG